MNTNPLTVFAINPLISARDIEAELLKIKRQLMIAATIYSENFDIIKKRGKIGYSTRLNEMTENLLSKKYAFGLDFNSDILDGDEVKIIAKSIADDGTEVDTAKSDISSQPIVSTDGAEQGNTGFEEHKQLAAQENPYEKSKKTSMFFLSHQLLTDRKIQIDKAIEAYRASGFKDSSKMMDVLIEMKYKQKICVIADTIAKKMKNEGRQYTEEEFKEALMTNKSYTQLQAIYNEINTQDKRDNYIPELYIEKSMTDTSKIRAVTPERVAELVNKERNYQSEFFRNLEIGLFEPRRVLEEELAENQNHDYAWGIVLRPSRFILKNEPVNSPIFKGRISVENLGSFTEYSMFRKGKYEREYEYQRRKQAIKPKRTMLSRLRISQNQSGTRSLTEEDKYEYKTMRQIYFAHKASKTLYDNILRVTKTDANGRTKSRIIISPLDVNDLKDPQKLEFIKNVYFSEFMLDLAERNGGYAGDVAAKNGGFYVTNAYNHEQMASCVLFSCGQNGTIFDCRKAEQQEVYTKAKKDKFLELVGNPERERTKNE